MHHRFVSWLVVAIAMSGCSHLQRDVEYNLVPMQPHVVANANVRVELIDINRQGHAEYLVVRVRIDNRTRAEVVFDPRHAALVLGAEVKHAIDRAAKDGEGQGQAAARDNRGDDDNDGNDDDDDHDWRGSQRSSSVFVPGDPDATLGKALANPRAAAEEGAEALGLAVYGAIQLGEVAVKGTYYVVKGTAMAVKGVHDMIDTGIEMSRRRIEPGGSTELAMKFENIPARTDLLPGYLFLVGALTRADGARIEVAPLLVTNPQEPHMGYAPPQRARLAAGLRPGFGGTWTSAEDLDVRFYVGLEGFLGPRVGPWSFTGVAAAGTGFMLGFDVRRDIVARPTFLSTVYLGYARHWMLDQNDDLVDGRGARVGVEILVPLSHEAYDWHVITGGVGVYLQASPMLLEEGRAVHISGGVSVLAY